MSEELKVREKRTELGRSVVLTSEDMPYEQAVKKEFVIGERKFILEGMSRKGLSYWGERKVSEDGCVVVKDEDDLQVIVVDGGTQIEKVPTLDKIDMTGGRYITTQVEEKGKGLNPSLSVAENLRLLNGEIGDDLRAHHPSINFHEHSHNTPYASIAGVKVDTKENTLEAANAGDVYVLAVDDKGEPKLLTVDDVSEKDQQTFQVTRRLADKHGVSFREAMQQRTKDQRFSEIVSETQETIRQGNVGDIRRLTGAPNFDVTSSVMISLEGIKAVFVFTDGGFLPGVDMTTREGQLAFIELVDDSGLQGLNERIKEELLGDPDYEKYPRFGTVDDSMVLKLSVSE